MGKVRAHWAPSEDVDPTTQQPRPVNEQLKRDVAGYALECRAVDAATTGQEGLKQLLCRVRGYTLTGEGCARARVCVRVCACLCVCV